MDITLTLVIVIMTSIISYQAFSNQSMKQKLIFHPVSVKGRGEFYRFLTSGFIHADFMHLLINMYVLYIFGTEVEFEFTREENFGLVTGRVMFILLYFGAIVFSSVSSFFKHQENNYYSALGASGGTSAILFAFIIFNPWRQFILPLPLPAILLAIAYLFYSSYMDKKGGDNIGHNAHFWGAVFGFVFTLVIAVAFSTDIMTDFTRELMLGPHWFR